MPNKNLNELISATQVHVKLTSAVIEKDYYVTQAINAFSGIENDSFRLIFSGGTCLAKAHKIVERMSEDIDFKVQIKNTQNFSRTRLTKEPKDFREQIKAALIIPDLKVENNVARNEGKYQQVIFQYHSSFPRSPTLRPEILVEFTQADIRLDIETLPVKSIIEQTLDGVTLFTPTQIRCISIDETAIEKWVGLTRRVVAIERNYLPDDNNLVRHIFDLNAIKQADKIKNNFYSLAKAIVSCDAKQFKNQHREYSANPGAEIKESLALLKNKPSWKESYYDFINAMAYDKDTAVKYEDALSTLEQISAGVIDSLSQ